VSGGGEFRRGGTLLAGCTLGIAAGVSSVYFYSLGLFIGPMAHEFGWGRGDASLGALVGTAAAALASPLIGPLVDRFGSFTVALCSLALFAASLVALGTATHGLTSFLVLTAILSLLTIGSGPLPYTRLIVTAFERHRGLALGVALAGTALGAILIPRLLNPFIAAHGWRTGYYALAAAVAVSLPATAWLLRGRRDSRVAARERVPLREIVREPGFVRLALLFLLVSIAVLGTVVQFVPMLADWGYSPSQAGATAGMIGMAAILGRLVVGRLLDVLAPAAVTSALFLLVALALVGLLLAGPRIAWLAALGLGFGVGAEVDLLAFLTSRYLPKGAYAGAFGALYAAFLLGGALGPALSGYLQQFSGSYRLSLGLAVVLLLLAAATGWSLRHSRAPGDTPGSSTVGRPGVLNSRS
jgi:MFS family permease